MRHKFVYSCSVKICASRLVKLLESIFCLLLAVEAFSLQKVVEMLELVVNWLARGEVNMMDEAKHHSPIHSTSEALVVQHVVRCCRGEELGSFC